MPRLNDLKSSSYKPRQRHLLVQQNLLPVQQGQVERLHPPGHLQARLRPQEPALRVPLRRLRRVCLRLLVPPPVCDPGAK